MTRTMQIHLTSDCTVRCPYCYIHQCKDSALTFEMFLQQYNSREEIYNRLPMDMGEDKYQVCFFGGEPTLNTDVMYRIADFMWSEGNAEFVSVVTNGTLLSKDMLSEFEKHHISYSLSFDGLWQKRIPYNVEYRPETETYFETLDRLYKSGVVDRNPKIMISPDCLDTLLDNYKYFLKLTSNTSPDFSLVKDDIWTKDALVKLDAKMKELTDYLILRTKKTSIIHSVGFIDLFLADTFFSKKFHRNFQCFAGSSGCCFTPTGIVYPCSRWYTNNKMPLYDSNTGHIFQESYDFFTKNWNTDEWKDCQECVLRDKCHFGCHYAEAESCNFERIRPISCVCVATKILYKYAYLYYQSLRSDFDIESHIKKIFGGF